MNEIQNFPEDNAQEQAAAPTNTFNEDLIRKYPRSNRKVGIEVARYSILTRQGDKEAGQSTFISPHGVEFQGTKDYPEGTLLKIEVNIPDYWNRKQRFVEYQRVDRPDNFAILAKVVKTTDIGKRGKRKQIICETVNMDTADEQVLKTYLQEG
jgi:hypothetical protein